MTQINTQIPDKIAKQLSLVAKQSRKSVDFHILKALEEYLSEQNDIQEAVRRLNDPDDKLIPLKEVRVKLRL